MGVISLLVATVFVLIQHDYKRLLAYLTTGHTGIICLGLGIGGFEGTLGAIWHLVNMALSMVLVWLVAGYIAMMYRSTAISDVQGLLWAHPFVGGFYLLGILALAGLPPFGLFLSFMMIIGASMAAGIVWVAISAVVLQCIIVAVLLRTVYTMLYGNMPDHVIADRRWCWSFAPFLLNIIALLALGVIVPAPIAAALARVANFVSP
jgi:hydrogenase-4 component F